MVRVGLWGTFDLESYGDMLFPRVAQLELARRIPGLVVRTWSPIGYVGRNRFEDRAGEPSEALGTFDELRLEELAREIDVLVIGGGDIASSRDRDLAPYYGVPPEELERRQTHRFFVEGVGTNEVDVPTAWNAVGVPFDPDDTLSEQLRASLAHRAYVSVRDERSRARLETAGVGREIVVVPDPIYLVPRLLPSDVVSARVEQLRETGALPSGDTLLVQGGRSLVPHADAIGSQVAEICRARSLTPVLVETDPIHGDAGFADTLAPRLEGAVRFPVTANADDLTAAIAWSSGFVGDSLHGNIVAAAYDRPGLIVAPAGQTRASETAGGLGLPERIVEDVAAISASYERVWERDSIAAEANAIRARVDEHFDRLAGIVVTAESRAIDARPVQSGGTLEEEHARYARAVGSLGRRMAAQQAAFADRSRDLETMIAGQAREAVRLAQERELRIEIDKLHEEVAWLRGIIRDRDAAVERLARYARHSPVLLVRRVLGRLRRDLRSRRR